jgi:heat shock protein HtpX
MFTRVILFLLTNLAVMAVFGAIMFALDYFGLLPKETQGWLPTVIFAAVFGFGGSLVSLALSKTIAKWSTGAHVIDQPRSEAEAWLVGTVRAQAQACGIGMPEVAIYPSHDMNAFATGMWRNSALVAVSEGLLHGMTREEIEAVLAHEVSHVANGDMVTLALLQGVLNTFVIAASRLIGRIVDETVFKTRRGIGPGYWLTVFVLEIVFGILATIIVMAFSRYREYRADAGSARLVGAPKMIAALQRLRQSHDEAALPASMRAFGIRGGGGLLGLFRSHPPLEKRIERLAGARG